VKRSLLAVVLLLTACGEPEARDLREWTPADHQPPEGETGDREGAPDEEPSDPALVEVRAATALFGSLCASCHGPSGGGDGPSRPPMALVPDFRDPSFQSSRSDEQLATSVAEGRGGFMPAFGSQLSPAGVAALVRHVRRLGGVLPTPSPTTPSPDDVAPSDAPTPPAGE
jgi:cytochrome c oxidase cbb3-type subunit 3